MIAKAEDDEIFAGIVVMNGVAGQRERRVPPLVARRDVRRERDRRSRQLAARPPAHDADPPNGRCPQDIAEGEGDLRSRLDEARKDELGEMGRWFNKVPRPPAAETVGTIAQRRTA